METQVPSCKSGTWCIQGGKSYPSILGGTYEPEGVKVISIARPLRNPK